MKPRVRLVLAGGMALEERLGSPKLESFHQRLAARCYLQALSRDETVYFVQEQVRRAGGKPEALFTESALRAVHTATDGIPRVVNQLCDHALILAAVGGHARLDAPGIEEAWADLQQLPAPWHEPERPAANAAGIVEFGQLDEDPAPLAVAGSIGPSVAAAATVRLNQIDRTIEKLQTGEPAEGIITGTAADDFSPADESGTEVDLIFHSAHDPFGSHWDEEEVVIDRYASLEDAALRNRQRTTSAEGRALGAAVAAAAGPAPPLIAVPPSGEVEQESPATLAASATFHPASDPLLPEEPAVPLRTRKPPATISLRAIADDDRDIIVVAGDEPQRSEPAARPKRQEYKQLFSNLRKKS
jgi:hypothetical protein